MKIYGYSKQRPDDLVEMSEVTIQCTPNGLRAIAELLNNSANELEENKDWGHAHLQDEWQDWKDGMPDVVVYKPDSDN